MNEKNKEYTGKDISILTDREHVRLRLPIYAGNTQMTEYVVPLFLNNQFTLKTMKFIPAVYKVVNEIVDNSLDEFAQIDVSNKTLTIEAQPILGTYTITDTGRGVPIDKHASGKYTPEVVFGSLRSGRNFKKDKTEGVIGQNGIGSSMTCFTSTTFSVDIRRDGKRYQQEFSDGGLTVSKPSIRAGSDKTGTSVSFELDDKVFEDTTLPDELMHNRAIEIALTNPGIVCEYNNHKYKFKKGFDDILKNLSNDYYMFEQNGMQFYVIFDVHHGVDEQIFSWVNSSLLFDSGLCNTQFLNAFYDKVITHLSKEAKKNKCEVTKNDIRQNLLVLGNLKLSDPQYDAQSKTRLTGPNLRVELVKMLDDEWSSFSRKNKDWLQKVFEQAMVRHHVQADIEAVKDHKKKSRKKVAGLKDATTDNRFQACLLITEGDSAASMITEVRDPKTVASLALSGKVNNVYGATVAQLLTMGKMADMLTAIGLIPGQKALRSQLRYGKVIISVDADEDGKDIFTLLINLFYTFWPELFSLDYEPFFFKLTAPNVVASKNGKRIHFTMRSDYEKQKEKYRGWTIEFFKGLGSMHKDDWKQVIAGMNQYSIPITDDRKFKEVLQLLFGPDAEARKKWLQTAPNS